MMITASKIIEMLPMPVIIAALATPLPPVEAGGMYP
jgi:hypothetical protein